MVKNKGKYVFDLNLSYIKNISHDIQISVVATPKDFKDFFLVPWVVYMNDKHWVPPFWIEHRDFFKRKNPFWTHAEARLFIAYQNGVAVGRITAIIDHKFCESIKEKTGYFGFFECINDSTIALTLFEVAEKWLTSKGMSLMRGPVDGRIDIRCGFLYEGFNTMPSILSSYSPKYYLDFAKKYEMNKSRDQLIYYIDLKQPIPDCLKKTAEHCREKGVKIRRFNRLRTRKEMKWWVKMMIDTFSDHWGYVPVSSNEVKKRFGIKQVRWFVDSQLFLVAEIDKQPVAFIWATPDYNQVFKKMKGNLGLIGIFKFLWNEDKTNQGKLNLIGVKREYCNQGIASYLNYCAMLEMKRRGYVGAEIGWVDDQNAASKRIIEKTGAKMYKKFRVFEKDIQDKKKEILLRIRFPFFSRYTAKPCM